MHAKATIGGRTVAETDKYEVVEGNIYFPPSAVDQSMLTKSSTTTRCPWKGLASYYNINLDKTEMKDAAWYYPEPSAKAANIKDHVAFCMCIHPSSCMEYFEYGDMHVDKNIVTVTTD